MSAATGRRHRLSGARGDLAALAIILLCALVLHRDAILHGRVYAERDTLTYYYPAAAWLASAVASRTVPLWTPDIHAGFPLFADGETGVFYPPNVVAFALLTPGAAFVCLAVLRSFLAGAFCYAFLRVVRSSRMGSLVGGLTFAFGSFMVAHLHHLNVVTSAAWLPLILLFAELALRSSRWRRVRYAILGGGALGMALLTIHIQPILMTAFVLGLYIAWRSVAVDRTEESGGSVEADARRTGVASRLAAGIGVGVAIGIVGLAIAAVQVLPLAEMAIGTGRVRSSYWFASSFGLPPPNLAMLLFPYFFRSGAYGSWTLWLPSETTLYVGIAPLLLAIVAVVLCRRWQVAFFTFLALLSLAVALDGYSPIDVYWLLWHVPGFSFARAPGRFTLLLVFSLAALAAFGTAHIQEVLADGGAERQRRQLRRLLQVASGAAVALVIALVAAHAWLGGNEPAALRFITDHYLRLRGDNHPSAEHIYAALLTTLSWRSGRTLLSVGFMFATVLLLAAWLRFPARRRTYPALVVALAAVDLLCFAENYHPKISLADLSAPSTLARFLVQQQGLFRVEAAESGADSAEPNRLLPHGIASVDAYSSLEWNRYLRYKHLVTERHTQLRDLWNVRYLIWPANAPPPGGADKYRPVFHDADVVAYENLSCLPRAFLARDAVRVDSPQAALRAIADATFDPRMKVVLEDASDSTGSREAVAPGGATDAAPAEQFSRMTTGARVSNYEATHVRIATAASEETFLVLADQYYPGWQATIDGRPAAIYRADYLFRAVRVPKGNHSIDFWFRPLSYRIGATTSIATLALLGILLGISYRRPSRIDSVSGRVGARA